MYTTFNQESRGEMSGYHSSPHPIDMNKGFAKSGDIATIKGRNAKNLQFNSQGISSKFTIGFEIEKNRFSRGAVKEYALFKGFERDSSCGFEAITNILPLVAPSKWRMNVFNMMAEAEKIIDERYSPSDIRCGGHITLGSEEIRDGHELMRKLREYSGLMYAMFRFRLNNRYCWGNKRMEDVGGGRYQVCLAKAGVVEFRLPNRVQSVRELMARYELCYLMMSYAHNGGTFARFLKEAQPIILRSYNGDQEKAEEITEMAKAFQKYINTGDIHPTIQRFV
jgi:hypothetical protein